MTDKVGYVWKCDRREPTYTYISHLVLPLNTYTHNVALCREMGDLSLHTGIVWLRHTHCIEQPTVSYEVSK